jgi:hypothetical protein
MHKDYTVEIYRNDKRCKRGEKLVSKEDWPHMEKSSLEKGVKESIAENERYEIHETYVTRKNMMSGKDFQERYDTPYCCSPSSETYWSM